MIKEKCVFTVTPEFKKVSKKRKLYALSEILKWASEEIKKLNKNI